MKKYFLVSLILCFSLLAKAQLFSDASGSTDLFVGSRPFGWIRLNTSDNSVTLGYNRFRDVGDDKKGYSYLYGGDIKVNVKEGIGKFFSDKKLKPGIGLNLNFGLNWDNFMDKGNQLVIYLRPGLGYNQYTNIRDTNGAPAVDKLSKWEPKALFNVNYFVNLTKEKHKNGQAKTDTVERYLSIGLSTGYKRSNNASSLDDGSVNTVQFGSSSSYAVKTEAGKLGAFEGYNVLPVSFDIGYTPRILGQSSIGFNSYLRTEINKPKNTVDLGVGIFVSKENEPRSVVGGLAWQFNDVANRLDKEDNLVQRSTVFFYVGFSLGK